MAVRFTTIWQVNPGRFPDFLAGAAAGKKILERLGGQCTLSQALAGGPAPNAMVFVITLPDMAAYAKLTDSLQTDPEWQNFVLTVLGAAEPAGTLLSNALLNEVQI
jgi:hypothetical protein